MSKNFKINFLLTLSKLRFPIYPIIRYFKPELFNRSKIIANYNIDVIFDVGANEGQFAMFTRIMRFKGEIISFEPLHDAFEHLKKNSSSDSNWKINNYALGNIEEKNIINISKNSFSSSFLKLKKTHLNSAPESKYIGQQEIEIKRLDAIFNQFCSADNNVMIKVDTQGFEKNVIIGAKNVLNEITIIQLEMSIVELYENETSYLKMIQFLDEQGFVLISLENGFANPKNGELLQVDGIFLNKKYR